jgi:hypothetical protein
MDKIKEFMTIAEEKTGIILAKRLLCALLLLFEIDRKIIAGKLGGSRLTVKKYSTLIESGNIQAVFADTVYRRRSRGNLPLPHRPPGRLPHPPLTAECMYEPEIFGRTNGVLWTIE